MKLKKTPLTTVTIRYGLIAGLLAALLLTAIFYIGQHPLLISPFMDYRILLFGIFIFFGLKEVRDNYQDGVLYFWQAMIGSYIIAFIASAIGALGMLILASADVSFVTSYIETMTQYLKEFPEEEINKIGKEVYERNLRLLPSTNGMGLAQTYFGQGILIGLFLSIILSVILRKQPKPN